jgi:hypothetical protein
MDGAGYSPRPLLPPQQPRQPVRREIVYAWAAGIVGVVLVIVIGIVISASHKPSGLSETDKQGAAFAACESAVKDQLKAPATAKFSGERYTDNDPGWLTTGSVDAQNSFGALVRNSFRCMLTRGDGLDFTVQSAIVS